MEFERIRPIKPIYYLEIAKAVARRSTCMMYTFGAVIVKNDRIVAAGYNGAPVNCPNCSDDGACPLGGHRDPELCPSVDAEVNAIISAARETILYGTMFVYGWDVQAGTMVPHPESSLQSQRIIINSGLDEVIYADASGVGRSDAEGIHYGYRVLKVDDLVSQFNATLVRRHAAYGSTKL